MKYILFILLLFSCVYPIEQRKKIPNYNIEIEKWRQKSIKAIGWFVYDLPYEETKGWLNPEEIIGLGHGDCSEKAALFSWLCYQYLGIKGTIYRQQQGNYKHQAVYIKEYNYKFNWLYNSEIIEILDFDTYFYLVEYIK